MRYIVLIIAILLSAAFVAVNWPAINQTTTVDVFFTQCEAPLGLMLLIAFGALFTILFCTLILQQGSALLGYRRIIKDLDAQRKLASSAENSRVEDVRKEIDRRLQEVAQQRAQENADLEKRLAASAQAQLASLQKTVNEVKESNLELAASLNTSLQNMDDKVTKALIAANQVAQTVAQSRTSEE